MTSEAADDPTPGTTASPAGTSTDGEATAFLGTMSVDGTHVKERKVYPAKEHGSVDIPLEELLTYGELDLYAEVTGHNLFTITLSKDKLVFRAGRFVGQIPINDRVLIDVRPRVPFTNLERVLGITDQEPLSLAPHTRRYTEHPVGTPSLLQSLAESLVYSLASVEAEGLHRQYIRRTADTSFPRGRIMMSETMRRHEARGMHHRAAVSWFEPSVDTPANRCVKYAIWHLARRFEGIRRSPENTRLLENLSRLYGMFDGTTLDPTLRFLSDKLVEEPQRLPANRAYYERPLRLAAMVARGYGVAFGHRGGEVELASLVVNLEDAFEEYLRFVLASGLQNSLPEVRVLNGNLSTPKGGGKNLFKTTSRDDLGAKSPATPDIVLRRSDAKDQESEYPAIFDVKYKVYRPRADRGDINQTVTYAVSYGSPVALIVHPHQKKSKPGLHRVGRVGNLNLYQYGFDLSADNLEEEEKNFVCSVSSLIMDDV